MGTIKFVNRKRELKALRDPLRSRNAELIILYGRRRVGKTELLKHLIEDLDNSVYFVGRHESPHHLLERLSMVVSERMNDDHLHRFPFRSLDEALDYITRNELVLVLDEFPYMVTTEPSLPSVLQDYWDNRMKSTGTKLILCGSSIAMMEKHLMVYSTPLYGRRTKQMRLESLQFKDLYTFFPDIEIAELIRIYGVLGGTPAYLLEYEDDIFSTIEKRILIREEYLYRDVEFVLKEELREPRYYFSILCSIAAGNTKLGGIMDDSGLTRDITSKYLGVLTDLGIIQRSIPITEGLGSRKGLYKIRDNYFRFWFRFIYPNIDQIEMGNTDFVIEKIKEHFTQYIGYVFEDIVLEVLRYRSGKWMLPFEPTRIGRWWDKTEEIDILALEERTGDMLYGEVKYSKKKVGPEIIDELKRKSEKVRVKAKRNESFMIISRSGFTKKLMDMKEKDILLFDLKDFDGYIHTLKE